MPRITRTALFAVFTATGFAALVLQVLWQRVIALHAGVDLVSITTVVSAFLAGLGLGSLLGGWAADRLGPRRCLIGYAAAAAAIAVYTSFSVWLLYDVYRDTVGSIDVLALRFAFNFLIVVVPTTLMGASLPLVARAIASVWDDAAGTIGRLYAVNTIGAAAGAIVGGYLLGGWLGYVGASRFAGAIYAASALVVLGLWRSTPDVAEVTSDAVGSAVATGAAPGRRSSILPWYLLYALTGAVALGLELVFFRVLASAMRANAYSFGHLLGLYLLFFGTGTAIGSRLVRRTRDAARSFLMIQAGAGVSVLVGLVFLVRVVPRIDPRDWVTHYFGTDGFHLGGYRPDSLHELFNLIWSHGAVPLIVMGLPVALMGASYPFIQAVVAERQDTLGRRTGLLLFANVVGNVAGSLLVGFVLLDVWGTTGTAVALSLTLTVLGAVALLRSRPTRRIVPAIGFAVIVALIAAAVPSNRRLWGFLHGVSPSEAFLLREDRTCVAAMKRDGRIGYLFLNGTSQNNYPFDHFHVLIGLLPALVQDNPTRAMSLGLGIGATPFGVSRDPRMRQIDTVEICDSDTALMRDLGRADGVELTALFAEPRVRFFSDDGRRFLLANEVAYDVVTVDALRLHSAGSGALYSTEFYSLVREQLAPSGIASGWVASGRTLESVARAFPHVMTFVVPDYFGLEFFLASGEPITFDRAEVLARFEALVPAAGLDRDLLASLRGFLTGAAPHCDLRAHDRGAGPLNRDLHPRDELFLNNRPVPAGQCD